MATGLNIDCLLRVLAIYKSFSSQVSQTWWCTPVIPELWRLGQENCKSGASLGLSREFKPSLRLHSDSLSQKNKNQINQIDQNDQ